MIPDLQMGGVQRMLLKALPRLRPLGIETEVVCIGARGELAAELERLAVPLHLAPFRSRLDPLGVLRLRRLARARGANILHGHMYAANVAVMAASLGRRPWAAVASYHSQTPFFGASQRRTARLLRNVPDAYVAVSESVAEPLRAAGLPPERIHTLPNGAELPESSAPLPPYALGEPLRAVWTGRFVKAKRLARMVEWVAACRDAGLAVHLELVGDGPLFAEVRDRAASLGVADRVAFPGAVADVKPHLRAAHLFASMSEREGFSNALLEACAEARGFLLSDIPPYREMLGDSRAGECLPDELPAWVAAAKSLDAARLAEMSAEARRRAEAYSLDAAAERYAALYRRLIADRAES
ncbi:MAG: glycosyltransferase [Candidatus Sumerlaeia bacterium]|nr:glycosyltransferase [Candidatus Sumerlaeia bacterium]